MQHMSRYRARTWLRESVPFFGRLVPPGNRDCGDHEWYRADEATDRCWHCRVGVRPHRPVPIDPDSSVWQQLNRAASAGDQTSRGIVLRMMAEHEAYEALVAREMQFTASELNLDATNLKQHAAAAMAVSQSLAAAARRTGA